MILNLHNYHKTRVEMPCKIYCQLVVLFAVFQLSFSQRRIKDGQEVLSEKPYVVYILEAPTAITIYHGWMCGGAIISKDFVITSAACVVDVKHMYVVPGYKKYVPPDNIEDDDCIIRKRKKVVQTCVPKDYEFDYNSTEVWTKTDIALVKVESPFDFQDPSYKEICSYIPKPIDINLLEDFPSPGSDVLVFGWGHTKEYRKIDDLSDMNTNTLQYASTKVIDSDECIKYFKGKEQVMQPLITSSMLCTLGVGDQNDKGQSVMRSRNTGCISKREKLHGKIGKLCETEKDTNEVFFPDEVYGTNNDDVEMSDILSFDSRRFNNETVRSVNISLITYYIDTSTTPKFTENNTKRSFTRTKKINHYITQDSIDLKSHVNITDIIKQSYVNGKRYNYINNYVNSTRYYISSTTKSYIHDNETIQYHTNVNKLSQLNNTDTKKITDSEIKQNTTQHGKQRYRRYEEDLLEPADPGVILPYIYNDVSNELTDSKNTKIFAVRRNASKNGINKSNEKVHLRYNVSSTKIPESEVTDNLANTYDSREINNATEALQGNNESSKEISAAENTETAELEDIAVTELSEQGNEEIPSRRETSTKVFEYEAEIITEIPIFATTKKNKTETFKIENTNNNYTVRAYPEKTEVSAILSQQKISENITKTPKSEETEAETGPQKFVIDTSKKSDFSDNNIKDNISNPKSEPENTDKSTEAVSEETETIVVTSGSDDIETVTETVEATYTHKNPLQESSESIEKSTKPTADTTSSKESHTEENIPATIITDDTDLPTEEKILTTANVDDKQSPDIETTTDTTVDLEILTTETYPTIDDIETSTTDDIETSITDDIETSVTETSPTSPDVDTTTLSPADLEKNVNTPGICQNDHGGPLVAWKDGKEILVAVATLFRLNGKRECVGPYLYTKTCVNSKFIKCIVDQSRASQRRCRDPKKVGFHILRRHISWVGHRDGPAENERPQFRQQIPMSAFHPGRKEVRKRLKKTKHSKGI